MAMIQSIQFERAEKEKLFTMRDAGAFIGCLLIALLLCSVQISGSRMLIAACLALFMVFHFWSCFQGCCFGVLLFFLPWSPLLKLYSGGISFFTLALLVTCLFYLQRNSFRFELSQILLTAGLLLVTMTAKGIQSNSIANSYLFFFAMILLFPCVVKGICCTESFARLTLFFACGIISAALSARQVAAYPNISQYIKVDSFLTITRLSGYFRDPNFYSAHITVCLAGIQILLSREKKKSRQLVWAILFVMLIYCGLLSASKSFVVVLACLFLVWIPIILERGNIHGKFALIVGILCAGVVFLSSSAVQELLRMMEVRFSYSSSVSELTTGRTDLWLRYAREFSHNAWLTLFGEGYTSVTLDGAASHNSIIQGIFQFGLLGFPILLAWAVYTMKQAYGGSLRHSRPKYVLLMCIGVALPWMALDILFFDEFFLLPIYAAIGVTYVSREPSSDDPILVDV